MTQPLPLPELVINGQVVETRAFDGDFSVFYQAQVICYTVLNTLDVDFIAQLPDTTDAVLVNTGRWPMVDEPALVSAMQAGHLSAAGLDVFESEPEVHPGLLDLENVAFYNPKLHIDIRSA